MWWSVFIFAFNNFYMREPLPTADMRSWPTRPRLTSSSKPNQVTEFYGARAFAQWIIFHSHAQEQKYSSSNLWRWLTGKNNKMQYVIPHTLDINIYFQADSTNTEPPLTHTFLNWYGGVVWTLTNVDAFLSYWDLTTTLYLGYKFLMSI